MIAAPKGQQKHKKTIICRQISAGGQTKKPLKKGLAE
jgi:hypothetical protein